MFNSRHFAARMYRYKGVVLVVFALCATSFYLGRYMHDKDTASHNGPGPKLEKSLGDSPALPVGHADKPLDASLVMDQVRSRGRPKPLTSRPAASHFVSALNKTWMTWTDIDSPGVYRACVPRPKDSVSMSEVVTGGLVEKSSTMTITHCLSSCISLGFTYAALSHGTECYCSDVKGESPLLKYMESALCDLPCPGEPRYHCGGREYMSLYRTSVPDPRCSRIELKPAGSLPLIALASYPRSGNTWTRQLIERGTGLLTGSVHWKHEKDMAISSKIFPGGNVDYQSKQTICVKSHLSDPAHIKTFEGAVLLIRNPYSALVAEIFRRQMLDQEKSADETVKYFDSQEWRRFAENQAQSWRNMAVRWITNSRRIHVAHYENLQENTYEELARIVRFLDVSVQKQRILCAIQEYPSSKATGVALGNHGRKTRVYLTKNPFPTDVRALVDENIKQVNATLIEHKLTPLPRDYSVEVF
ncbi:WSC domain-containing protein 2-like isoform X2 [Patiria miniata]|uniref:WSC domain-containing protein n=1 Tax=Patiria miniata TaxID=46514 RepID=A0A913ZTD9_PATMI|nr:WSC domain-containing protein 2-like isoform X2 [Patiria miniata]